MDRVKAHDALLANLTANDAAGDRRGVVSALAGLGAVSEPTPEAAQWFARGVDEAIRIGYWHGQVFCVFGVAGVAARAGRARDAVALDRALRPYKRVFQAQIPPSYVAEYEAELAQVGAAPDEAFEPAPGAPAEWHQICERARVLAADLAAGAPSMKLPAARRRGPRDNPDLTRRELEVLTGIAQGHTNPRIAAELFLSVKTVMHHSTSIYRKLGVRGRAEAVAHAYRHGLLAEADR
jgi:DNA-binding CsgD family transcriptional regulator